MINLFVAYQGLIACRKGTESCHHRSARALGWWLPAQGRRNSFETTCPAEIPCWRANSLAAANTSASMARVVRTAGNLRVCIMASAHQVASAPARAHAGQSQIGAEGAAPPAVPETLRVDQARGGLERLSEITRSWVAWQDSRRPPKKPRRWQDRKRNQGGKQAWGGVR